MFHLSFSRHSYKIEQKVDHHSKYLPEFIFLNCSGFIFYENHLPTKMSFKSALICTKKVLIGQ